MYFSTVDSGKVHIADEGNYLGSINSYNNRFTQFFAKYILRIGIDVDIGGKKRCLQKKEYAAWLKNCGIEVKIKDLKNFRFFSKLGVIATENRGFIRAHLTEKKVEKLTRNLITALRRGNFSKAMTLVGKGADVNRTFWDQSHHGWNYDSYRAGLPRHPINLRAISYTPLLYAAEKKLAELQLFMEKVGGDRNATGKVVDFTRQLYDVQVHQQHHLSYERQSHYMVDRRGRCRYAGTTYSPYTYTTTHVDKRYLDRASQVAVTRFVGNSYQPQSLIPPVVLDSGSVH